MQFIFDYYCIQVTHFMIKFIASDTYDYFLIVLLSDSICEIDYNFND